VGKDHMYYSCIANAIVFVLGFYSLNLHVVVVRRVCHKEGSGMWWLYI
jgi:hypothetical protein